MEILTVNYKHAEKCNNQVNINDYLYLINEVARCVASTHPGVDERDLYSIGYFALTDVRMQYDPERNVKFNTVAFKYLKCKMLDEIKRLNEMVRTPKGNTHKVCIISYEDSYYEPYSMEAYYDEEEQEWRQEAATRAKKALGLLTSEERLIFDCRIAKAPMTYATISRMLHCSIQNAQQEYQRGIKKMRRFVESGAMAA